MKKRSIAGVLLFPFITFGIYSLYLMVSTKGEMNKLGAKIPTAWLIIIPFVNIWWMWEYSKGAEQVTKEKVNGVLAFILLWLLGFIGQAILQDSFNKVGGAEAAPVPATNAPVAASEAPAPAPAPAEAPAEAPKSNNLVQ